MIEHARTGVTEPEHGSGNQFRTTTQPVNSLSSEIELPTNMKQEVRINVFCRNLGWLFEDLKRALAVAGAHASTEPERQADAWICIRSREWEQIPDLGRAVVQIHDLQLRPAPSRLELAGCVQFVHPFQASKWQAVGFKGRFEVTPIGSRACIAPAHSRPARPTIGFFCRVTKNNPKGSPLFHAAVLLARRRADFDVLLIGSRLEHLADLGRYEKHAAGPRDYARIDALACTTQSPCVPLSAYEACAAGLPVISTPRQFPGDSWPMILRADSAEGLADHIVQVVASRPRHTGHKPYTLESWADETLRIARQLCGGCERDDQQSEVRERALASSR